MIDSHPYLQSSCCVALATFSHSLNKFAERACIPNNNDTQDKTIADINKLFGIWETDNTDDSLVNIAVMHKPESFLQWVIATADGVTSGIRHEELNHAGKKHFTARQLTLMEQINTTNKSAVDYQYRYALQPLSVSALFPVKASDCEHKNSNKAQKEYLKLWNQFIDDANKIPKSHQQDLPLWLDHFDTLWGHYAYAIPSATASQTKSDISLYDHSRTTAALATALWRYHHENNEISTATRAMQTGTDWDNNKFLLIQGDFFGIQNFIFTSGGETHKHAAKLLRGRSFYISLLSECAALKILDSLGLPSTSQVINAAGKFLIVAPNTEETKQQLQAVQYELNQWFLKHTWGQAGIGFAWEPACCNDFLAGDDEDKDTPFKQLMTRLFSSLDEVKYKRFDLCNADAPSVFEDFLTGFDKDEGVCPIDGCSPAMVNHKGVKISKLAKDQIDIGSYLTKHNRLIISRENVNKRTLGLDIFGYHVTFTDKSEESGHFSPLIKNKTLLRFWDFSLPSEDDKQCLWKGYAKRAINGYVPIINDSDYSEYQEGKFDPLKEEDKEQLEAKHIEAEYKQIKNLNLIACEDRKPNEKGNWQGIKALTTLKGDIDNLGMIFQKGLDAPSFSKMAALSRQFNAFFTLYLPWLCKTEYENSYTVFAGGDDFFLIGPWHSQIKLANKMREEFQRYVAYNKAVHFSVGLSTTKAGMPIAHLAEMSEQALDNAKAHNPSKDEIDPKNAVSCYSQIMFWDEFAELMQQSNHLQKLVEEYELSTGYVYGLLHLIDMASQVKKDPSQSIWHSYFSYRTMRLLESKKISKDKKSSGLQILANDIAKKGIEDKGDNYRVALFNHLYQQRN